MAGRRLVTVLPTRHDLRTFARQLRGPHRVSALRAVADGLVVTVILRRRGVRFLLRERGRDVRALDPARAGAVAGAVDAGMGLLPLAPTCLRRSLTLSRELHRLGLGGTIHLGVRELGGRVEAHAWVQVGDEVVNDDRGVVGGYTPLAAGELERLMPTLR
ncbi:hypothetical protein BH23ACT2_BH23ACT2_24780 [soil metagenome]|jgi:hypothetical protein